MQRIKLIVLLRVETSRMYCTIVCSTVREGQYNKYKIENIPTLIFSQSNLITNYNHIILSIDYLLAFVPV